MIDSTLLIRCNVETNDDFCEAEFVMEDYDGYINPIRVAYQLQQRGWRIKLVHNKLHTICPLHKED